MLQTHEVDVCIVGGGPAGLLLGLLLVKQGLQVLVLEQHQDFSREYRGEVLMPRFAKLFDQLNLLSYMETFPHTRLDTFQLRTAKRIVSRIPMSDISKEYPYALWMPQPIFLEALYQKARAFETFEFWFGASARDLLREGNKTVGVMVKKGNDEIAVRSRVTVGADGRTSRTRHLGGFEMAFEQYDFDLLWFSLPRPAGFEHTVQLMFTGERPYIIAPKYPNLIQCGLLTEPGQFANFKKAGIDSLKNILMAGPSEFQEFAKGLKDLTPFFPLQARISQVKNWSKDGLLLIGDAAHTCSPIGAVGVSVALATAAVAADIIPQALSLNDTSAAMLSEVQQLRQADVDQLQAIQRQLSRRLMASRPWMRALMPLLFSVAAQLGILAVVPRKLATYEGAYPISAKLRFD